MPELSLSEMLCEVRAFSQRGAATYQALLGLTLHLLTGTEESSQYSI